MLQQGHRRSSFARSPHNPQILNLEPFAEQTFRYRLLVIIEPLWSADCRVS